MFNREQLTELIEETLNDYGLHSDSAVNLILGTIAQESAFGTYIKQLGGGPALGICQMEPSTHEDIWKNYIKYRKELYEELKQEFGVIDDVILCNFIKPDPIVMTYNLRYSIIMCRIHYLRQKPALPQYNDIPGLAQYWKKFYNTPLGKGTEQEFIDNYLKCLS